MKYTVKFHCGTPDVTSNGSYEDFYDAERKCLELVADIADAAWVELTEQPEMKSRLYVKPSSEPELEVPEPKTAPVVALPRKKTKK